MAQAILYHAGDPHLRRRMLLRRWLDHLASTAVLHLLLALCLQRVSAVLGRPSNEYCIASLAPLHSQFTTRKVEKLDLSAIRAAVETAIKDNLQDDLESVVLEAASALPTGASDFDRGIAAGFAAASLLRLQSKWSAGVSQVSG